MKMEFAGTCPKDLQELASNEDQFKFSEDGLRLALCDGASESYNSRLWAKIISQSYATDPKFDALSVEDCVHKYIAAHNFSAMSWSQQSAYERGSFSTLLGVEHDPVHRVVNILAIGDCIAVTLDGDRYVEAWPFADPDRFKERPELLSTQAQYNAFVSEPDFCSRSVKTLRLDIFTQPRLYCMTDALGEWALRHALAGTDGLARLAALTCEQELCDLVFDEREHKRMRVDDSTLIVLSFGNLDGISVP